MFVHSATAMHVIEKKHNYQITGKDKKEENKEFLFIVKNELYQETIKEGYATSKL